MFDLKTIIASIRQIAEEREIPESRVQEIIETAFAHAYKKEYREKNEVIRTKFNPETGDVLFFLVKTVVDESMIEAEGEEEPKDQLTAAKKVVFSPERHIMFEEAIALNPNIFPGEELEFPLEQKLDFGRIAAQTAKQVLLQKLHEIEKETIFDFFKSKEGEIVSGIIQRMDNRSVYVDLGKTVGMMFPDETIPGERYFVGNRMKFYIVSVEQTPRGLMVALSRSHPKFIGKLFANEVPEISDGIVEVKSIAREAGSRTKIAVSSNTGSIDPIGACVGQKGTRVTTVTNELGEEEKIDIILWSDDPIAFISHALAPAKVEEVEMKATKEVRVLVAADQLSLAIGRDGQNARLAAKLTNCKIEIKGIPGSSSVKVVEGKEEAVAEPENGIEKAKKKSTKRS